MTQPLALLRQHLFTAVLSDCLDAAGYRDQATREALARGERLADVFKRHGIL
jgi:hypothetical protein